MDRVGRWLFMLRNYVAGLPLVFALVSTYGEWEADVAVWTIALSIAMIGVMLRAWAACHCNYGQGGKHKLTRSGPYQYVRNPLYVGNTLIAAGATVASELVWLVPVTIAWCVLVYTAVARFEERRMLDKFGEEYESYLSEVPAWFPSGAVKAQGRNVSAFVPSLIWQSRSLIWLTPFILKEIVIAHR